MQRWLRPRQGAQDTVACMQESRGAADMRPNDLRNLLSRRKEGSLPNLVRYATHSAGYKVSLAAQRSVCPGQYGTCGCCTSYRIPWSRLVHKLWEA